MRRCLLTLLFVCFLGSLSGPRLYAQRFLNDSKYNAMEDWIQSYRPQDFSSEAPRKKTKVSRKEREAERQWLEQQRKIKERIEQEEKERKHTEELRRREEAFVAGKDELRSSMRGMSSRENSNSLRSGLRGVSGSSAPNTSNSLRSGLRGISSSEESQGYTASNLNSSADYSAAADQSYDGYPQPRLQYSVSSQYSEVADPGPKVVFFYGPDWAFYRRFEGNEESWLDKIESKIDRWKEQGQHKVLTTAGEKLMGFTKKTISNGSAWGKQVMRIYDYLSDAAGIKNISLRMANKSMNAVVESSRTGKPNTAEESGRDIEREVNDYYLRYMESKRLISPRPSTAERLMKQEAEEMTYKVGIAAWTSRSSKD